MDLKRRNVNAAFVSIVTIVVSVLALLIVAVFSIWSTSTQSLLIERLYKHPFTVSTNVLEADRFLVSMHRHMKDVVIAKDSLALDTAVNLVAANERQVIRHLESAKQRFLGSPDRFQGVIDSVIAWRDIRNEVIQLMRNGRRDQAAEITINKGARYVRGLNAEMAGLVDFARSKASEFLAESRVQKSNTKLTQVIVFTAILIAVIATFLLLFSGARRTEKKIEEQEYRFRSIYQNVPVSVWDEDYSSVFASLEELRNSGVTDLRQYLSERPEKLLELANSIDVRAVNAKSLEVFEASNEALLVSSISDTFGPNAIDVFKESMCALWDKQRVFKSKANYIGLMGKEITGQVSVPLPRDVVEAEYVPVVIEDITEAEQAARRLSLLASVFTNANEGMCITSPDGIILEVNDAFESITGYRREECIGKSPSFLKSGRHDAFFYRDMWNSLDKMGRWEGEVWNRRKSGEVYPEQLSINVVKDESGGIVNFIGLFSDISQIKDHEDELKRLAQFDPLTSLPNRALLADRLQSAIASSDRNKNGLAVAYIDLDEFKQINDTYGHDVGDDLLIGVSNRLADSMRASDTIARIGGDEFVAIFNAISEVENLVPVLDRILQDLLEPFDIGGIRIQVSASIGVALYTTNKNTGGDQLQRQADQAMYEAKQAGRNTYRFFDPEQDSKISKRFALIAEVEKAISENEFELYYQPKVNMRSGEVIGAEALIRWNHPERGFLSPGQFLPEINEHKVGIDIGTWVIKSAVDQISDWEKIGLNLPISINISPDHLQQENFVDQLSVQIKQAKVIKPELLQLEILETSALEDFPLVTEVIQKCKGIGIDFALDDFGAGYSSLVYLKKLSVSTLKIDQEFVRNILNNPDDELILSGVIGLAEKFKLRVLAEGVETIEHAAVLLSLGCELGQGYAFAKPMQSVTFVEWLEQWKYKLSWQSSIEKFFADGNQKPAMKSE